MALPAFASLEDLDLRIPGGLRDADRARAWGAVLDASALVRVVVLNDYVDADNALSGVPDIFVSVVCASARRALDNPDGLVSETESLGSYSDARTFSNPSADVYLTKAEISNVRKAAGITGLWTQSTTRDPDGLGTETPSVLIGGVNGSDEFLPVDPPGDPILWGGRL